MLPADQFDALIRMGRARAVSTQDDLMTVLRSVELSADLIIDVVARIRAAGIEFTYDTGETHRRCPMTGAVADDLSDRLARRSRLPVSRGTRSTDGIPAGSRSWRSSRRGDRSPVAGPPTRRPVPQPSPDVAGPDGQTARARRRSATKDGYVDGDGFRGSAADPVHMYLKEIGKVPLLDAALEVELAERIEAGNEAAERLAGARGRARRAPMPERAGRPGARCGGARRPRRR